MTLVIVTKCPINPEQPTQAMAVIADTRLSGEYEGKPFAFDRGKKVFQVGLFAAYAYSGLSSAGLAPLSGLRDFFSRNIKPAPNDPLVDAEIEKILRTGLRHTTPNDQRTWYQSILAFADSNGTYTRMIYNPYIDRGQNFVRYTGPNGDGPWLIGSGASHVELVQQRILDVARDNPELANSENPMHCAFVVIAALEWVANLDRVDPYVGGTARGCLITQSAGYHEVAIIEMPQELVGADLSTVDPHSVRLPRLSALP